MQVFRKHRLALAVSLVLSVGLVACGGGGDDSPPPTTTTPPAASVNPWMTQAIIARQAAATTDSAKEAVANQRAKLLLAAMTLDQKLAQLVGKGPEVIPELPECYGARHVSAIRELDIPTFRITNGPVGLGQNDCVAPGSSSPYTDASSAKATALPSAIAAAASFDPAVAGTYGEVIGDEMNNLALHVFEAPGVNMARLPTLGRNFEYFGEDPYLTGTMAVAEIKAIQARGLIGMAKHFVANEQETNRMALTNLGVDTLVDRQVLREIYMIPFEMSVKDGKVASIMCAYNHINGEQSCGSKEMLTDVLRTDWGFTGYVQSDFYATFGVGAGVLLNAGLDHEMPIPISWSASALNTALSSGAISVDAVNLALERRYTQAFKYGIFDRKLVQTGIDFAAGGVKARDIGVKSAVLLQNNGALPFDGTSVQNVVLVGKATQVYAQQAVAGGAMVGVAFGGGGGSSDVVPSYSVTPLAGIKNALSSLGNASANVRLILVDDANATATIDGASTSFAAAQAAIAAADAVIVMAGTISEEGADRASFTDNTLLSPATSIVPGVADKAAGMSLDWYVAKPSANSYAASNAPANSNTVAMISSIMGLTSTTARTMVQKTALVLKDNAGVALDAALVGAGGPAILEAWFPGQEDGNIVADLLFGKRSPSGKLPVTFPFAGRSFLDDVTALQFPGVSTGTTAKPKSKVAYTEGLHIGYRWYDAEQKDASSACYTGSASAANPCVAFPFGHGLSYTSFGVTPSALASSSGKYDVSFQVTNQTARAGEEVVQVYVELPAVASSVGEQTGATITQPPRRLVGFKKVTVAANGTVSGTITIDPNASNHPLSVWNQSSKKWERPSGTFKVWLGNSSSPKDLQLAGTL
ncbi:beta-glucosidase family protein [Uliginosibacterium sp. H1]|uniref:beta-glucosidase family protein n=1 Tax=Uliginosibacterium sp. H1 TaxID=3114757 RepID=UPI002E18F218|nr:glycoside hydrolase family 3 N-terminal domain-containing protein [Uliginosibacterium sp. H1]